VTSNKHLYSLVYQRTFPFPEGPDPKSWKGEWTSLTHPEEITLHVCSANVRQYNQASSTPFATPPLSDFIEPEASTDGAASILRGEISNASILEHLQPETIQILQKLTKPASIQPSDITTDISPDGFMSCYPIIDEKTSSSTSGRHVGHYKATCDDPGLAYIHSRMMSIPFLAGFSDQRWQKVIDIMLRLPLNP
jgi:hypothetical protein